MGNKFIATALPAAVCLATFVAGCGSVNVNVWPFGGEKVQDRSRPPANATEFQCQGGKRFHVRYLDNGSAAWVILPEREFRLDKTAAESGTRYGNGIAVLDINGSEASLADSSATSFANCKAAGGN